MEHLQSFIADCDRRTELAKRRLKETQEELSEEATAKVASFSFTSIFPKFTGHVRRRAAVNFNQMSGEKLQMSGVAQKVFRKPAGM